MDSIETLVVGAGVIGLAAARELARSGREVVIVESAEAFGTATSSRNSEVVHAGLYYEPDSLKALLCVEGRRRLLDYCQKRGVASRVTGKLIVAGNEGQRPQLERIALRAASAGADDLGWLSRSQALSLEPALDCDCALLSPSTGIVDSHGLMLALLGDAQDHGATLACRTAFVAAVPGPEGFTVRLLSGTEPLFLNCREIVNAAGLGARAVASSIEGLADSVIPPSFLAKGNYFSIARPSPFRRLIYPVPNEAGLGVHLTLDLAGQTRFGPDVEWVRAVDYRVDEGRRNAFAAQIRAYWPGLPDDTLMPAYAGIRPKIVGPGEAAADFRIDGAARHGIPGLVNLFGIESPGLTACMAIAIRVREALDGTR